MSKCGVVCGDSMPVDTSISFRVRLIMVSMPPGYTQRVMRNVIVRNWGREGGSALSRQIGIMQQTSFHFTVTGWHEWWSV
jgi:hypothetical protein